jgi:hypothetical protein
LEGGIVTTPKRPREWRIVDVFLAVRRIQRRRHPLNPLPELYRATWVTCGTSSDLYVSSPCVTPEQAEMLAVRWLLRQNSRADALVQYKDVTSQRWWAQP